MSESYAGAPGRRGRAAARSLSNEEFGAMRMRRDSRFIVVVVIIMFKIIEPSISKCVKYRANFKFEKFLPCTRVWGDWPKAGMTCWHVSAQ